MHSSIRAALDDDRASDPWGTTMCAMFGLADVLAATGNIDAVPAECEYRPGLGVSVSGIMEDDSYFAVTFLDMLDREEIDTEDMADALRVLSRYADVLKRAKRDH